MERKTIDGMCNLLVSGKHTRDLSAPVVSDTERHTVIYLKKSNKCDKDKTFTLKL